MLVAQWIRLVPSKPNPVRLPFDWAEMMKPLIQIRHQWPDNVLNVLLAAETFGEPSPRWNPLLVKAIKQIWNTDKMA